MISPKLSTAFFLLHFGASLGQAQSTIAWSECPKAVTDGNGLPSECGTFAVPFDYTDSDSTKKLNLTLVKIKADVQPSRGSILINPGGPGAGGAAFLSTIEGALVFSMTGRQFDLVGFDYRGTGDTLPVECYDPESIYDQAEQFKAAAMIPQLTNASSSALGLIWASAGAAAIRCHKSARDTLPYISTAFTARDFIQVVDALGEDGMLRYWGHSYGTELGATIASMFPERIDKMVIDGVINPHDYTEGWEYEPIPVGDVALEKFLEACITAGPDACALARSNATVASLTSAIHNLYEQVKVEPVLMGSNITTDLVGPGDIMNVLNNGLRIAQAYAPYIAAWFDAIFRRNLTAYHAARAYLFAGIDAAGPFGVPTGVFGIIAIRCADSTFRADTLDEVRPRVEQLGTMSYMFGDTYTAGYLSCARWKVKGKEQYTGDYKAKTKNPMLIIGSPYDLRTPLVSAKNVSAGFEGSVVLQHNGLGHTVLYSPGQCAIQAVRDYFNNGTLPAAGTVCEQDYDVFSGVAITESFLPQGGETNGTGTGAGAAKQAAQTQMEYTGAASMGAKVGWAWVVVAAGMAMGM
ncbi:alpha/beta-hydrolase [Paraphaeosphaeria sporulosa]|uniref:Alpha/beta-hydrolase n=1 Tax=Paraphaeosphaeria sporulosa TaxID=1460663 RepID=A0A177CQ49_9PLEO|nr:alpha/beta-hydrolase [Paraphaeosphaeria sporulosa]OAG09644.1 alpha/beta-hydrolase [Paraphaeosphaeria sporulosa]